MISARRSKLAPLTHRLPLAIIVAISATAVVDGAAIDARTDDGAATPACDAGTRAVRSDAVRSRVATPRGPLGTTCAQGPTAGADAAGIVRTPVSRTIPSGATHDSPGTTVPGARWSYEHSFDGDVERVVVRDGEVWLATFTVGARTVALTGPERVFAEPSTTDRVVASTTWVRLLPAPFDGDVDVAWLASKLSDHAPDVLAVAMQYVVGSGDVFAGNLLISADAHYGPLVDGVRQEGSDWNDFQGVTGTYGQQQDGAELDQYRSVDCSGYVRMVFGRRSGVPMLPPDVDAVGEALPRRAVQMEAGAPGVDVVVNEGVQATDLGTIQSGDLVFFDASDDDGTDIDHVGIYLGLDDAGHHRFISSRKTADGPTMGDLGGRSTLDGAPNYHYASAFRSARRI